MRGIRLDRHSLTTQIILGFVLLALLIAVAAGLPGLLVIRNQLRSQAWAQVYQGQQAAQALYDAERQALSDLATLIAERPSLQGYLARSEAEALAGYLQTLEEGAGVDLLMVCDEDGQPLGQATAGPFPLLQPHALCQLTPGSTVVLATEPSGVMPQAWIFATQSVATEQQDPLGRVVVGQWLDTGFVNEMRLQTGLDHSVLVHGLVVASSLPGELLERQLAVSEPEVDQEEVTFSLAGEPYYAGRFLLNGPPAQAMSGSPVRAEAALAVADVAATEQRLVRLLLVSILLAAVLGILLAVILAQRIGRPLASLAEAAAALSNGDLSELPPLEAGVSEVALVSQALESSRVSLQRTLDELRREKAWTDHLLGAIVEGIVTLDREGFITFFSPGAERITGWSQEQVLGRNCDQLFITVGNGQPFSSLLPAPGRRSKIPIELPDSRQVVLAVTGARLLPPEGGDAPLALVFRDISEEEVIHRLLSHFLANVTHEFRTPLSAVAASVELLRDQAADLEPGELQELLDSLHVGVLNLQKLVDNLLETASIEAGRFQVHPRHTDLGEIIAEATRTIQPLLDKHGQHLVVQLPVPLPVVRADPRRTVQVLVNLLSNASKYGPDNAQITLGADVSDGWVRVVVIDQGPGIPEAYRRDLFRRFMIPQVEIQEAQVGFGLGLSVVKAIVEAHGGHVGVEDAPAGGSGFWFTLPTSTA